MMNRVLITSGKGGVGKTTLTANMGAMLSIMGHHVAVVDGDAGLRNLDAALGLQERIIYDAKDIVLGHTSVTDGVINHPQFPRLDFIAAPQDQGYDQGDVVALMQKLDGLFDIVLVDSPAGIDDGFAACMAACNAAIIVTTPDVSSVRDAIKTRDRLRELGTKRIYLVVNRVRPGMARWGGCMRPEEAGALLEIPMIGEIKESRKMITAGNMGDLTVKGRIGDAIMGIAKNVIENLSIKGS